MTQTDEQIAHEAAEEINSWGPYDGRENAIYKRILSAIQDAQAAERCACNWFVARSGNEWLHQNGEVCALANCQADDPTPTRR